MEVNLGPHAIASMLITVSALYLFTRESIRMEYSCLLILCALSLGFEIFPYEADGDSIGVADFIAGFGNPALVTIVLLLMLARGIELTGALQPLADWLTRIWQVNRSFALLATMVIAAVLSAFFNNTPLVVMLLPLLISVANKVEISPSRVLMPVGFATIIGGMSTTIGTSTNLLVVSISADLGGPEFGIFDYILPASIAGVISLLFLWVASPLLLPEREPPLSPSTPRLFDSMVELDPSSPLVGLSFSEARKRMTPGIQVHRIQRQQGERVLELVRLPSLVLKAGDYLYLRGTAATIKQFQRDFGGGDTSADLSSSPDQMLVEIVVTRGSPLYEQRFRKAQNLFLGNLQPIGMYRPGGSAVRSLVTSESDFVLRNGDILLMQGNRHQVRKLVDRHDLMILEQSVHVPRSAKAPLAIAIMTGVVAVAALGWMPILGSALVGFLLMLLGRCLAPEEAWRAVDAKLILLIATSLALGVALTKTGAADFIALAFVELVRDLPPPVVVSAILLLAALLTEIVTNNAVAIIATPIAMLVAQELQLPAEPFVLAVLFGANMSYMTPIGYQTNLLVFTVGGYKFSDFFRLGIPLQIVMWAVVSILLTVFYL